MTSPQEFVEQARHRAAQDGVAQDGNKGIDWVFFWCMTPSDREAFDKMLVEKKHPLAYQPGTTESRFRIYCQMS